MHKILVLYPHPKSPEHFRQYYAEKHIPLSKQLPGLKASRYSFSIEGVGAESPYFCVWEGDFANSTDMAKAMSSPIGQKVAADAVNYASGGIVVLHYEVTESS